MQLGPIFVLRVCIDRVLPTPEWNTSGVVIPLGLNRTATAKKAIDGRNATSVAPGLQLQYPILKVFIWMGKFFLLKNYRPNIILNTQTINFVTLSFKLSKFINVRSVIGSNRPYHIMYHIFGTF